jgi:hypothetical protein
MYMVQVLYHPADPAALEAEYPAHVDKAGPLVKAAAHVYAGPFIGSVGGKAVTRGVVFLFESKEAWTEAAASPEGAAVIYDAGRIAGPEGLSLCLGEVTIAT